MYNKCVRACYGLKMNDNCMSEATIYSTIIYLTDCLVYGIMYMCIDFNHCYVSD